jgi:hypothetical protein
VMIVEKEIDEIGRIGRSRRPNEDEVNSKRVETRIGQSRGRWMAGGEMSVNVGKDRSACR